MPRIAGQIDRHKSEAILDAAIQAFSTHGFGVSLDEVAKKAGVSKQTIYNHFGSKEALISALVRQRRDMAVAPITTPDPSSDLEDTLTQLTMSLAAQHGHKGHQNFMRLAIGAAPERPELARIIWENGAAAGRITIAAYLHRVDQEGLLKIDDAEQAAEFFQGLTMGHFQTRGLLGLSFEYDSVGLERRSREIALRFIKAYS